MANPYELESFFWSAAQAAAFRAGFEITPDCGYHLRSFIGIGVTRLASEGRLQDVRKVDEAKSNLVTFVEQMIAEAKTLQLGELHEPTFFGARARLCPLWPFC